MTNYGCVSWSESVKIMVKGDGDGWGARPPASLVVCPIFPQRKICVVRNGDGNTPRYKAYDIQSIFVY